MKRPWTRSEKWLWATPLLFGAITVAIIQGPGVAKRAMGLPQVLGTTPDHFLSTVVLSRDGSILAATGRATIDNGSKSKISPASGTVYLWDARTLRPLKSFAPQYWRRSGMREGWLVSGLSLSPNGKLIGMSERGAAGFGVYEVATQKLLWRTSTPARYSQFSDDGRFVALGQFEMREARTGKLVAKWKASNASMTGHFALSHDAKIVAYIGKWKQPAPAPKVYDMYTAQAPDGHSIELRRTSDGKILRLLSQSEETEAVAFSPDGKRLVSTAQGSAVAGNSDGTMIRCHSLAGKLLWQRDFRASTSKTHDYRIFSDAIFSPDGKSVALRDASSEKTVLILDANTGRNKRQLKPAKNEFSNYVIPPALAFSANGKRLFMRGKDAVLVWELD